MSQDDPIYDAEPTDDPGSGRKPCPMCGEMIAASAKVCRYCGHWLDPSMRPRRTSSATDRLLTPADTPFIAIAAGYLGLFSLLPFVGVIALIVSIFALRSLSKDPDLPGRGRAWFGLIMGIVFTLIYSFGLIMAVTR